MSRAKTCSSSGGQLY